MSALSKILAYTGGSLLVTFSVHAADSIKIGKAEFERLWSTSVAVSGEVESYTPGKGDALIYQYQGQMHPNSDNIALVRIRTEDKEPMTKSLRVSVPKGKAPQLKLLRQPGSKITFSLPLLFVKYDPWGFVPFEELKGIGGQEMRDAVPAAASAGGVFQPMQSEDAERGVLEIHELSAREAAETYANLTGKEVMVSAKVTTRRLTVSRKTSSKIEAIKAMEDAFVEAGVAVLPLMESTVALVDAAALAREGGKKP